MKKLLSFLALFVAVPAFAQTALVQTTFSAAVTSSQQTLPLASVTGIVTPSPQTGSGSFLFADGEIMLVKSVTGSSVSVVRGQVGTKAHGHVSGSAVLIGPNVAFVTYGPFFGESCTVGSGSFAYAPIVASVTGLQWLCSPLTGTAIPGFQNGTSYAGTSAAVASAAGLITPSGPLFHVTGTAAITGFNIPVGFNPKGGGGFCIVPDGVFTTTNANNIAVASTAVVGKTLCYTYDPNSTKFSPSY